MVEMARSQKEADEIRIAQIEELAKSYGIEILDELKVIEILSDTVLATGNISFYKRWLSEQNKTQVA
ncbi:MAG: hypothetical protein QM578_12635 [Pantoea sp.]|uniref:hypothetical protein n=1 Tax=Pantoea sp. TaxID=69393 RepID=UPI0039E4D4CF